MSDKIVPTGASTYLRLLKYVRRYWLAFVVSIFGLVLHSFAEVAFVDLLGFITDTVGTLTSTGAAEANSVGMPQTGMTAMFAEALLGDLMVEKPWLVIPFFLVTISVLRGIGYLIGSYGLAYVSNYLVHALRVDIFEKYLQLPFEFFDRSMSGHLVSVVTFNVQQVTQASTKALKTLLQQGSLVLGLMGYLFYVNWKLTLFFLAVMPFVALVVSLVSKRFRMISTRIQGAMGDVTHVTQEVVSGYQEVRMFGGMENERARIQLASQSNRRQNMKMALTEGISNPLVMLLVSSGLCRHHQLYAQPGHPGDHEHRQFYHLLGGLRHADQADPPDHRSEQRHPEGHSCCGIHFRHPRCHAGAGSAALSSWSRWHWSELSLSEINFRYTADNGPLVTRRTSTSASSQVKPLR